MERKISNYIPRTKTRKCPPGAVSALEPSTPGAGIHVLAVFLSRHSQKKGVIKNRMKSVNHTSLCKSLLFCSCFRMSPQCWPKSNWGGGGTSKRLLANMGLQGCQHKSSLHSENGYNLPFKVKPPLTRIPIVKSGYANPLRNSYLQEALHSFLDK